VLADQALAQEIGVTSVPSLLVSAGGRGYLVSGAQPYATVREAVEQAAAGGA
jgi:predicted DsbA family dithiol-disulfide isomerase